MRYAEFGEWLTKVRAELGLTQAELATRLNLTQQTVSRWEQGLARPRQKDASDIAVVLGVEEQEVLRAGGFEEPPEDRPVGAPTRDQPLPLYALLPETFERFCADFLVRYYRPQGGRVERYGGPGHKQLGIDIAVRLPDRVHAFQCKRVETFGEQKVHTAAAAQTFKAELSVLLLSSIASPKARDAIAKHPGWELWDREDISRRFRDLPMVDRKDLVDTFFPGQREALLGETEDGPLMTADAFFRPLLQRDSFFRQDWNLVGRDQELAELHQSLRDAGVAVVLLVGAPGTGKTRVLRDAISAVASSASELLVRFVSPTEDVRAHHLAQLGRGRKLLVVDDAHDRDDLGQLLRYAADEANNARLLLALRPYGKPVIDTEAARAGFETSEVAAVSLRTLSKEDAQALATEVLRRFNGPVEAAEEIAKTTYGAPLITVLAAQVVAQERIAPALLLNAKDFQRTVLSRLQDVLTGRIAPPADAPKLEAVLRMVALLQPVVPEEPVLLNVLEQVEGLAPADSKRLMRLLRDAGVLFKRGIRYRLAPDLLADSILQTKVLEEDGTASEKVLRAFELADVQYLKHLLVNLGRLEWRMRQGDLTQGTVVLRTLEPLLRWSGDYQNAHVEAVQAVAYYQPQLAIDFAAKLIEQGHGHSAGVSNMLKYAAYNPDFLEDACHLLWKAAQGDARPLNQHPSHGVRVLKELAQFERRKPVEYVRRVVEFVLRLLGKPKAFDGPYTPFEILEGALNTELQEYKSSARSVTITRYKMKFEAVRDVRLLVTQELVRSVQGDDLRRAYSAAASLAQALRGPMDGGVDGAWHQAQEDLLQAIYAALTAKAVHPVVLMRVATSVGWHAGYGSGRRQELAQGVVGLLDSTLEGRLVRALVDGWGTETWKAREGRRREAHELHADALLRDLTAAYPSPAQLYAFVSHWMEQIRAVSRSTYGSPAVFVHRLLKEVPGFAEELFARRGDAGALDDYRASALAVLLQREESAQELLKSVLSGPEDDTSLELLAEAYARFDGSSYDQTALDVIKRVFESKNSRVLWYAAHITLRLAKQDPALALDYVCRLDLANAPKLAEEVFMWVANSDTIPADAIAPEQWKQLFEVLGKSSLDEHWARHFVKEALKVVPQTVIEHLKTRLQATAVEAGYADAGLSENEYSEKLQFLAVPDALQMLRGLLDWAVSQPDPQRFHYGLARALAALCGTFDSAFLNMLLSWMKEGTSEHVDIAAAVLQGAQNTLIYEHPQFIRDILDAAERKGQDQVDEISAALYSATVSGGRTTTPGEPFQEDVQLERHAREVLATLGRSDPAFKLYSNLLRSAAEGMARQRREKEALDADEEV